MRKLSEIKFWRFFKYNQIKLLGKGAVVWRCAWGRFRCVTLEDGGADPSWHSVSQWIAEYRWRTPSLAYIDEFQTSKFHYLDLDSDDAKICSPASTSSSTDSRQLSTARCLAFAGALRWIKSLLKPWTANSARNLTFRWSAIFGHASESVKQVISFQIKRTNSKYQPGWALHIDRLRFAYQRWPATPVAYPLCQSRCQSLWLTRAVKCASPLLIAGCPLF